MTVSLANLVAELEYRMTGSAQVERLAPPLAATIPSAATYVLALFDGLGTAQLSHPAAPDLAGASTGTITAPFPSTTTVSMATIATGTHPVTHGTIGHQMWVPRLERVVNVLKWRAPSGQAIDEGTSDWLPAPNLWERLRSAGAEPITVQPGQFADSPLTRALYRGVRFEPVFTDDERIDATVQLAAVPNRLVFAYFAEVDFAAHVHGQRSPVYADAVAGASRAWTELARRLPDGAVLVGTSDHGHVDFTDDQKILIRDRQFADLTFYGDPRALYVRGDPTTIQDLASNTASQVVEPDRIRVMLGTGSPHPELAARLPDALLLPPPDRLLLPRGMDRRLVGYHGGDTEAERSVPLMVSGRGSDIASS